MAEAPETAAPGRPLYPVMVDLTDQRCLVVGGGRVAARKVRSLAEAGARVVVVAPEAVPQIADDPRVAWQRRRYERGEVAAYRLAITATGDGAVDGQVFRDGEAAGVLVNSADDPDHCRFVLPAVSRRGDIVVATSTGGRSPALATWLRRRFDELVDDDLAALLDLVADARAEARRHHGTSEVDGWQAALDDGLLDLVRAGDTAEASRRLRRHLDLPQGALT